MRVQASEDLRALLGAVETAFADHSSPAQVRSAWTDSSQARHQLWPQLCRMGLPSLTRSEELGGGLSLEDLMPILELAGRHAVAVPLAESVAAAAPVLGRETDPRAVAIVDAMEAGEAFATVQLGWAGHAPWATVAEYVLVVDGDEVVVCEPTEETCEPAKSQDGSRWIGTVAGSAGVWSLAQPGAAQRLTAYATVSAAATLNGLAEGVLRQAAEYGAVREQFGRPIGSFQAIRHRLAAAFSRVEFTRRYAYYAAWAIASGAPDAFVAVRRAKATAGEVAVQASYAALQTFGALGYTWECDLHLWMKKIQALDGAYGSSDEHWHALAGLTGTRDVL